MFEDAFLDKPLEVVVGMSSIGVVADGEVELFACELLGKCGADD